MVYLLQLGMLENYLLLQTQLPGLQERLVLVRRLFILLLMVVDFTLLVEQAVILGHHQMELLGPQEHQPLLLEPPQFGEITFLLLLDQVVES
jgi:hypothetical protein